MILTVKKTKTIKLEQPCIEKLHKIAKKTKKKRTKWRNLSFTPGVIRSDDSKNVLENIKKKP